MNEIKVAILPKKSTTSKNAEINSNSKINATNVRHLRRNLRKTALKISIEFRKLPPGGSKWRRHKLQFHRRYRHTNYLSPIIHGTDAGTDVKIQLTVFRAAKPGWKKVSDFQSFLKSLIIFIRQSTYVKGS